MRRAAHLPISPFGGPLEPQLVHVNRAFGTRQRSMLVQFLCENLKALEERAEGIGHLPTCLAVSRE